MADDKKIIFSMVGVGKLYPPSKQVLKDIYLSFYYGAKIGIIGLNGSGKSTLLKIIAGLDKSYLGEVVISAGYSVGYLSQEPELDDTKTVRQVVEEGVQDVVNLLKEYEEINNKFMEPMSDDEMAKLIDRQGEVTELLEHHDAWELDTKLERAMDALRCPEGDAPILNLSGGERRRVALCRLLLQEPDILLLDEPTNHLDAESIEWLELHLKQYKGTVIAVTHDRYFLDNVAGWILELDRGEGIPWQGNYSSWLDQKTKRLIQEERSESKRRKTLERELEWVRMAPKARQAKGKARLAAYDKMMNEDVKQKEERLEIFIPNGPRLGNKVIEVHNVTKAYGDKMLYENLNFSLPPAGIVGVIGPNGAGKTTLFRLIMGSETPDSGEFKVGETVRVGYIDQQHAEIDPEKDVWEVISGGNESIQLGGRLMNSRAYVSRFNFSGPDQGKKTKVLSGGERNRLHLAMTPVILAGSPTDKQPVKKNFLPETPNLKSDLMTPEVLWSFGRIGSAQVSPDGKTVLYDVTWFNIAENKSYRDLYLVPAEGGQSIRITDTPEKESEAAWRPDGKKIGYISTASGDPQLWEINPDGTAPVQISKVKDGISGFKYAPDLKHIFYIGTVKLDQDVHDKYPDLPLANARLYDDIMYRHWDTWSDGTYQHVFVATYTESGLSDNKDLQPGERYDSPLKPNGGSEQITFPWMAWSPPLENLRNRFAWRAMTAIIRYRLIR